LSNLLIQHNSQHNNIEYPEYTAKIENVRMCLIGGEIFKHDDMNTEEVAEALLTGILSVYASTEEVKKHFPKFTFEFTDQSNGNVWKKIYDQLKTPRNPPQKPIQELQSGDNQRDKPIQELQNENNQRGNPIQSRQEETAKTFSLLSYLILFVVVVIFGWFIFAFYCHYVDYYGVENERDTKGCCFNYL
jgi:hypothetical protein